MKNINVYLNRNDTGVLLGLPRCTPFHRMRSQDPLWRDDTSPGKILDGLIRLVESPLEHV